MSTMRFRTSWLARLLRGRRLDRNPLRRGSGRAETIVLGALLAAFLAAAPFAAHAAGAWGHDSAARQARRSGPAWSGHGHAAAGGTVLSGYGSASGFAVEAAGAHRTAGPDR
jgi:hypothetical protein